MTDQPESSSSSESPKLRRRLLTAAPATTSKVKFASPAAEGVSVAKPRFLTPELQAKLAQEQAEAERLAAERAEADRIAAEKLAAEQEAARIVAEQEAAKRAAEEEAARIKAEQEAARIAAEQEAARIEAEKEAARIAAEQEAARVAAEQKEQDVVAHSSSATSVNAQLQDALAKVAAAQKALADAQAAALAQAVSGAPIEPPTSAPIVEKSAQVAPTGTVPKLKVFKTAATAPVKTEETSVSPVESSVPKLKVLKSENTAPVGNASASISKPVLATATSTPVPAISKSATGASIPVLSARMSQPLTAASQPVPPAVEATTSSVAGDGATVPPIPSENPLELAASVSKSKSLLKGAIYGVSALAVIAGGLMIFAWNNRSEVENANKGNARLEVLVTDGAKLGQHRLFDSKNLSRVPDVKVNPNAEDAALLLENIRGVKGKGNPANWPGAAHLVSIMAQMDDNIARQVVGDMKKNVSKYSKDKYSMMITLLAKSSSPVMRDLLKDLYASISNSDKKKIQEKQAIVLKYMRFAMKLEDLDEVMKILQQKGASQDLINSAFRTARYLIDKAPDDKRKALSSKLLQYQNGMPEENNKLLYKLLARTGDPKVLEMMEKIYKEDSKKALVIMTAWEDWNTDDAVPFLFKAWKDESLHERVRSEAHDSILRVLSVDRDRDDNATLKLFEPLIEDAKTSERRQFLVSAFRKLSNRPYVIRLLGRIKQTAEDQLKVIEPKFQAAEDALFKAEDKAKANPNDAAAKADYEVKEKEYNDLTKQKTGEDKVIAAVEKAMEKVKKTPVPTKKTNSDEDENDETSAIKTI